MKYSEQDIKNLYLEFYKNENFEKFFPHAFKVPSQPFHEEINQFLDRNPQLAVVIAPRDVGKTTNVTLYKQVLKRIAYRLERFIVVFSGDEAKAAGFLATIKKEIKENKLFSDFYHLSIPSEWVDNKYEVHIRVGSDPRDVIILKVFGAGQDPRGLNIMGWRPTLMIHDDYEGLRVRESLVERRKLYDRFWSEVYYSKDSIDGKIWFVGTPPHEDSLIWKLYLDPEVPSLFYSSIKDDGTALWEAKRSLKEIEFDRARAERDGATALALFYAEIMCDPSPIQMQVLNPQKLRRFNRKDIESKMGLLRRYVVVDLQSAGKETSDYDVFAVVAVAKERREASFFERWYILDIKRGRWSEPRKLEILEELVRIYEPIVGIENVGYQRTFIEAAERQMDIRNCFYHLEALSPRGVKKTERIMGLETPLNTGVMYIPEDKPSWIDDLYHEMSVWSPTKDNTHDDILDVLAYVPQLVKLHGGGNIGMFGENNRIEHGYWGNADRPHDRMVNIYADI